MANPTPKYPGQCRTFGELSAAKPYRHFGRCAFCHEDKLNTIRYSTRHSICEECVEPRKDVVLPRVKRRERLQARLSKAVGHG